MEFVEPHEAGKWPSAFWAAFWLATFSLPLLISFADSGAPAPVQYSVVWIDSLPSVPAPTIELGTDVADIALRVKKDDEKVIAEQQKAKRQKAARQKREEDDRKQAIADKKKAAQQKLEDDEKQALADKEKAARQKREDQRRKDLDKRKLEKQAQDEEDAKQLKLAQLANEELRLRREAAAVEAAAVAAAAAATAATAAAAEEERLALVFGFHIDRIKKQIERKINRPAGLPFDADIEVIILIRVDADGFLIDDPLVWETSHYPDFDEAAMRAVIVAQPLLVPKNEPKLLEQFRELRLIVSAGDF